jgi:hypothetical protein
MQFKQTHEGLLCFRNDDDDKKKEREEREEINMLTQPIKGQKKIIELYHNCSPDKKTRFNFILAWFSSPRFNYNEIPDDERNEAMKPCLDQWQFIYYRHNGGNKGKEEEKEEEEKEEYYSGNMLSLLSSEWHCCCSQKIEHCYYYQNVINGNILLIGSWCIKKFAPGTRIEKDYDLVRKVIRTCLDCKKRVICLKIVNGLCPDCYPSSRHKQDDKRICLACFQLKKCKFERCKKCYRNNYPKHNIVVEEDVKTCSDCGEIFYAREEWKKVCLTCYKKNEKTCSLCKETFYAREKWKKVCLTCYKKGRGKSSSS